MRRLLPLPGLVLIWSCSAPPELTKPSDLKLRPAQFEQVERFQVGDWTLRAGTPTEVQLPDTAENDRWFTLSLGVSARYLFREGSSQIQIYQLFMEQVLELARIPLPLRPGRTWPSRCAMPGVTPLVFEEWGSCTSEPLTLETGTYDALRVDFSRAGVIHRSLSFAPGAGLVQWSGIHQDPISLTHKSMTDLMIWSASRSYERYGRVDETQRVAPGACWVPPPAPIRASASRDEATHGKKLYYLYAKHRPQYLRAKSMDQPEEQIVIKESWIPGEPRRKGPLFMMMKYGGDWIYATASADGKKLTASGKLPSCMKCHESEPTRDRMFGLPPDASK